MGVVDTIEDHQDGGEEGNLLEDEPADFETAIAETGFGKFNFFLVPIAICCSCVTLFETTTMSYVFPAAQCDLNLTLEEKGMLNAATYAGTIASAFFWGFLFDTFGRRKLLMIGYLLDGIIDILSGFSPNKQFLMLMKFIGGFIINGPFAAIPTYLSELHVAKYRSRMPLLLGVGVSLGGIYLPFLAALILPLNFKIIILDILVLHSWGVYLLVNALPAILSGIVFIFLPESPKFLMSKGRNKEALVVFQTIYSINSGKSREKYPIKKLVEETMKNKRSESIYQGLKGGWAQIRPLFGSTYLLLFLLVCALQMFVFMSFSTLRLWMPQIFQAVNDYKFLNNDTSAPLCEMISSFKPSKNESKECFVNFDNLEVYINSAIVAATSLVGYLITGFLINAIGQKRILNILTLVWAFVAVGLYFAPNDKVATGLLSIFKALGSIGMNVVIIIIVNLFPTTLRTMTVSLSMMTGRAAGMIGNLVFPYLLKMGCGPPFFSIASLIFSCFILSLVVPQEKKIFI
ncbi:hypothetical protein HHI36_017804 [Cryptolaemus montrouzieri]|uniref:Major facilitator superfamily (MFS) profile domain-containing protein n=1 Tax=Cryptolaemus montrouzieri TaxID=559131 RepID=A0ABD2NNZ3_9CUCU